MLRDFAEAPQGFLENLYTFSLRGFNVWIRFHNAVKLAVFMKLSNIFTQSAYFTIR